MELAEEYGSGGGGAPATHEAPAMGGEYDSNMAPATHEAPAMGGEPGMEYGSGGAFPMPNEPEPWVDPCRGPCNKCDQCWMTADHEKSQGCYDNAGNSDECN